MHGKACMRTSGTLDYLHFGSGNQSWRHQLFCFCFIHVMSFYVMVHQPLPSKPRFAAWHFTLVLEDIGLSKRFVFIFLPRFFSIFFDSLPNFSFLFRSRFFPLFMISLTNFSFLSQYSFICLFLDHRFVYLYRYIFQIVEFC